MKWENAFCKKVDLTPQNETKLNQTLFFLFYILLIGGGGAYAPNAPPPCLRACVSCRPIRCGLDVTWRHFCSSLVVFWQQLQQPLFWASWMSSDSSSKTSTKSQNSRDSGGNLSCLQVSRHSVIVLVNDRLGPPGGSPFLCSAVMSSLNVTRSLSARSKSRCGADLSSPWSPLSAWRSSNLSVSSCCSPDGAELPVPPLCGRSIALR